MAEGHRRQHFVPQSYLKAWCDPDTPAGPYAEGAHIKPLGAPHRGPDTLDNLLCLCPNHHLLFDVGAITIADDMTLIGTFGKLRTIPKHAINVEYVRYHRAHYAPIA
jgi:putative restriction endonuclease